VRVCIADGVLASHWQHLPGQAAWLVCEARFSGERKYYLTSHPPDTPRRTLVRAIKARWACEQAHQQLKRHSRRAASHDLRPVSSMRRHDTPTSA
jgi:hypothetical protein